MQALEKLTEIRKCAGSYQTHGLSSSEIKQFLGHSNGLDDAIDRAFSEFKLLKGENPEFLAPGEAKQIELIQDPFVNFYSKDAVNPYVALAANGPWIVTSCGAVIHDSGGYGMLGFGHKPEKALMAMSESYVMANIMTASFSQLEFIKALKREIGHSRSSELRNPFSKFMCLNSGSESVTMACRIADINAKKICGEGGSRQGAKIKVLGLRGSFHGRTDRPAQFSDSCLPTYRKHLASFQSHDNYQTVEVNNIDLLEQAFEQADREGIFFEAMFMEPVMGEGNPGMAIEPSFYKRARELCSERETLLFMDSIQAGLRAHGCLSVTDYPGFEALPAPDLETYSKALNAGQYPLSVLALGSKAAELYVTGIYGNTMTSNPRALSVATAVLSEVDESLRSNIRDMGKYFLECLNLVKDDFPEIVTQVQGTGLLLAMEIDPKVAKVVGSEGLEQQMRKHGIGVIHGGKNALRFTPHFLISREEIDLIGAKVRFFLQELMNGPNTNPSLESA